MSTDGKGPNFWVTMPGVLTAIAGLVTAVTGLLIALNQVGVIGADDTAGASQSTGGSSSDTGGGQPPPPFESTAMYEMAQHLFDPSDCSPVLSREDAPLAWNLEPQPDELVRCTTPDRTFSAVFMCSDAGDVTYIRTTYLGKAIQSTRAHVPGPPAGWGEEVDGVQESFQHVDSDDSRVYWDSPVRRCAAELQSPSATVSDTVSFWSSGIS
jgi:hypothetical protein